MRPPLRAPFSPPPSSRPPCAAAPLFLIDLALPRDIAPEAADLANVYLYNLDDLASIAESNRLARVAEVAKAEIIITEKTQHLWETVQVHVPFTTA
ncbi:MAG: hypothetical protein J6386_01550 [Candidatus Synoicihabitans palmerolidicus]|nr:hypothetical protein [Candidatus Synoicihabitans palmerolidicus]